MEFFYELISTLKNYYLIIVLVIILIIINDVIIIKIYSIKNEKQELYSSSNNSGELVTYDDEDNVSDINTFKVDIKGQVKEPGVYIVSENMNVQDAINAAGGLTKNALTDNINLSKKLKDQMVIIIPKKTSNIVAKTVDNNESTNLVILNNDKKQDNTAKENNVESVLILEEKIKDNEIINDALIEESDINEILIEPNNEDENKLISINNASLELLMTLPGIGESKAKAIIEYRKNNSFSSIDDIKNVSGIGESLFEKIKNYITI